MADTCKTIAFMSQVHTFKINSMYKSVLKLVAKAALFCVGFVAFIVFAGEPSDGISLIEAIWDKFLAVLAIVLCVKAWEKLEK